MTVTADIHRHNDSFDESFDNSEGKGEQHNGTSSAEKPKSFKRPNMGFGLQASGPLSTKASMANMKFHGRQFAVSTQQKVKNAFR